MGFGPGFDVMPRSQQFTSSNWKQYDFSNRTFSSTTKSSTCHFWKSVLRGFPPEWRQFPPVSRQFRPDIFSTKFHILPELCLFEFTLHHDAGCISHTSHLLPPSNCNTCLCCQRVLKLPRFKIPPSGCFFARTLVQDRIQPKAEIMA